jgi:predicted Zn-dependent peptidase
MALDEVVRRIDAVTVADLAALTEELWDPERLSAAGIGPDAERFDEALGAVAPELAEIPVG